jgi:cytochrome P450
MTFIGGGVDTTTATLAHSLRHLSRTPANRQALLADPERIPLAVEEFLRCFPPVRQVSRTVAGETEFRGMQMRDRERVHVSVLSANHDEAAFESAGQVDITRAPNPHVSFGLGLHRCAGLNVARAELVVMLARVLARIPDFSVLEAESSRYSEAGNVDGWVAMPATFTPAGRVPADVAALGITEHSVCA